MQQLKMISGMLGSYANLANTGTQELRQRDQNCQQRSSNHARVWKSIAGPAQSH